MQFEPPPMENGITRALCRAQTGMCSGRDIVCRKNHKYTRCHFPPNVQHTMPICPHFWIFLSFPQHFPSTQYGVCGERGVVCGELTRKEAKGPPRNLRGGLSKVWAIDLRMWETISDGEKKEGRGRRTLSVSNGASWD